MELDKLKSIRTYVPAVILCLLIQLFNTNSYQDLKAYFENLLAFDIENAAKLVVYVVFGFLYNSLKWRRPLFDYYLDKVQMNIKKRLLKILEAKESMNHSKQQKFIDSNLGMNIFYKIVDNDASLSIKSNIVKHNGALWSSLTDIALLSLVFCIVEIIRAVFLFESYYFIVAGITFLLCVLASILNHIAVNHHIELTNEQLDIIEQQFSEDVYELYKNQSV